MKGSETLVLLFFYTTYFCVQAENGTKTERSSNLDLLPEFKDHMVPKVNLGNDLLREIGTMFTTKENQLNKVVDTQVKQGQQLTGVHTYVSEIYEDTSTNPERSLIKKALFDVTTFFGLINTAYQKYLTFNGEAATDSGMYQWINETRKTYTGPISYLDQIFVKTVPQKIDSDNNEKDSLDDLTILPLFTNYIKGYKLICNKNTSQQQIIRMLYISIVSALHKVYTIIEFCYRKLAEIGQANYDHEMNHLEAYVKDKYDLIKGEFRRFMHMASREVWRCDPKDHVEGETYVQLYNVFQKFVVHDNDVNNEHTCTKTCDSIKHAEVTRCDKSDRDSRYDIETGQEETSICEQQRACNGFLYECESYFARHKELWICPSAPGSTRRYEFMMHGDTNFWARTTISKYYGVKAKKSDCGRNITYDYSTWGKSWADGHRDCEICLCTCVDWKSRQSDKLVNIRPAVADENYVVTGVRLVKDDHTLNIQIEQGKVLTNGQIDTSSIHWKKIAPVRSILDLQVINQDCRGIYLGVTEVPKDRVIVGVKLSKIVHRTDRSCQSTSQALIGIRTLSAPYNFSTGYTERLTGSPEGPFDKTDLPVDSFESARVNFVNPDIPTKCTFENLPQPDTMRIVNLTTTDFEKDLGQTLIPFFDIQEVKVRPAVPLSGIGFYHKGREGYGGFVGVKLLTYDFSQHMN